MITVSFVKFPLKHRPFAFAQMGLGLAQLSKVQGLTFFKLMGSGAGNGFSIWPDLSTYCLLAIWENESAYQVFLNHNTFWNKYTSHGHEFLRLVLSPTKTKGTWEGSNPFLPYITPTIGGPIAVLTRATIRKRFVPYFWSQVPRASRMVGNTPGHIYSKGVGELPLFLQATISIWESIEHMYDYAYRNKDHIDMIRKTREKGWYKEESFTEFDILKMHTFEVV